MSQHHEEEPETIIAADIFFKSIQHVRLLNAIWFKQEFIQIQNNDKNQCKLHEHIKPCDLHAVCSLNAIFFTVRLAKGLEASEQVLYSNSTIQRRAH